MEKIALPLPPKEWEVRWASLAIFFLDLGLGEFCTWRRLEPAFGENRLRFFAGLVSPAEGASALALAHLISCMHACVSSETCSRVGPR